MMINIIKGLMKVNVNSIDLCTWNNHFHKIRIKQNTTLGTFCPLILSRLSSSRNTVLNDDF